MATVRDLIKGSLRLIGAVATGETPSADEQVDALNVLNEMLDSWSNENLIINAKVREEFSLIPGQSVYTVGPGGNFSTTRPLRIEEVLLKDISSANSVEYMLHMYNMSQWASIPVKSTSGNPTKTYIEGTNPLETVNLWPVPSVANKLVFYSWKALTAFANANATISLPPGYLRALRYNLAIELCPEYGKQASAEIISTANDAKENIKRMNIKPVYLGVDVALLARNGFNIISGE